MISYVTSWFALYIYVNASVTIMTQILPKANEDNND